MLEELWQLAEAPLTAVFPYELPLEKFVARLAGRRFCSRCKTVFHKATRPPKVEGVGDQCGGILVQRENDQPKLIGVRMKAHQESARPLIEFYKKRGRLVPISAEGTPEEIYKRIRLLARGR